MGFSIDNLTGLTLGQQGEHLVKTIRIDMSTWLEANADLQVYAVALRHGETTPYLAATTMDEQELVWPVSSIDTGIQGVGMVQIIGSNGTSIAKSKVIRTTVGTILPGSDEEEAPTLYQDTIDQLLADMGAIQSATESARDDAEIAQEAAETAQGAAEDARDAALAAQQAAEASQTAAATSASQALSYRNTAASHAMNAQRHRLAAEDAAEAAEGSAEAAAASATAAAQSYNSSAQSASLATAKATEASQSAAAAEVAAGHYPRIVGGYWQVWDAEHSQWNFTGVKATGDRGPQGEQGIQGPQGPQGEMGFTGPRGLQGPQGDKGDKGDIGLTGPRGDKGEQGDKGDKGDPGPTGPQGPKGDKGDTGDTGPQGPQGIQGEPGDGVPAGGTTGQVLAKASDTDRDTEWIDVAPIIHNTASGSVASFSDGLPLPADQVTVGIEPVQDLHGYDAPWPAGGGKNKLEVTSTSATRNNVTITVNSDGTISLSGTATDQVIFEIGHVALSGEYILSGCPSGGNYSSYFLFCVNYDYGSGATVTFDGTRQNIYLYVRSGVNTNGLVFKPMIRLASETDATFAPYANICPITGFTGANVTRTGKNLVNVSDSENVLTSTLSPLYNQIAQTKWEPLTQYVFSISTKANEQYGSAKVWYARFAYTDGTMDGYGPTVINRNTDETGGTFRRYTVVSQSGKTVSRIYFNQGTGYLVDAKDIMLEKASAATEYEAPQVATLPVSWQTEAGTVYGGELDVTTGVLTVDRASEEFTFSNPDTNSDFDSKLFTLASATTLASSGTDKLTNVVGEYAYATATYGKAHFYAGGKNLVVYLPENTYRDGIVQICYPLATFVTYQLTAAQLTMLLGENRVWADTGDVSITYKADTKRYIDAKFAELSALIANL